MKVAVASRDGKTVSGHIGRCAQWIVYAVSGEGELEVSELARITLEKPFIFHHYKDQAEHPLGDCCAVIGGSAGDSFVEKMRRRGIEAVLTAETDPAKAVADYVRNRLASPKPRPIGKLVCKIVDSFSSDH